MIAGKDRRLTWFAENSREIADAGQSSRLQVLSRFLFFPDLTLSSLLFLFCFFFLFWILSFSFLSPVLSRFSPTVFCVFSSLFPSSPSGFSFPLFIEPDLERDYYPYLL
ncbi:hypothetical protein NC652_021681 [Populus alba x Populus x berolinensis]|nr:hypothetical protein NC652_021681 [Populus alba x Populus x berolinensis]